MPPQSEGPAVTADPQETWLGRAALGPRGSPLRDGAPTSWQLRGLMPAFPATWAPCGG